MHYPAIVRVDGHRMLVTFPDCPSLERLLDPAENIVMQAQEALEQYLAEGLAQGAVLPHPSASVQAPEDTLILHVPLSPALAEMLEAWWRRDQERRGNPR